MSNAYHRIISFSGGNSHDSLQVNLGVYLDQAARDAGKNWVEEDVRVVILNDAASGNIFTDLYASIKGLPEYAGAVDV